MAISRRQFLGASAAAVIAAGTTAKGKVFGANDKVRVCVIGCNGRGRSHIGLRSPDDTRPIGGFSREGLASEVAAICDVDANVLERIAKMTEEQTGKRPRTFRDLRDVMADDSIDAISIATPNHWHSLAAIWGCQANKDVYVEKPLSHNLWEGRQLVAAAKQNNRVVQHGTQRRSEKAWRWAMQQMRDGVIGDVYMGRALCYKGRGSIGFKPEAPAPDTLDWDLWQGPAAPRTFSGNYHPYNWHWFWAWGNGDIGNQGVHQMDVACWGMGKGWPVKVSAAGGRYGYEDQGETPNTLTTQFSYADGTIMTFEVRGLSTNDEGGVGVGNLFYGSKGWMAEAQFHGPENLANNSADFPGDDDAYVNFINAVHSRKPEEIYGTAEDGHIASGHCHLANAAYRVGHELTIDPNTGLATNSEDANKILSGSYRDPFVVPALA